MTNSLRIERLHNTYLAPRDHPAPERIRSQLDDAARTYVAESCGRALSVMLDQNDPSVWVIENLSVDFLMDLSAFPVDEVASFWAQRMADSVVKTMARGADGERVMHFPSRAAYLARFLRDLAAGNAWGKWYYSQFGSLRSLPSAAAIREALLREPMLAEPALFHLLETNDLGQVARWLSEREQERILQLLAPDETSPTPACFQAVLDHWMNLRRGTGFLILEAYLRARVQSPEYQSAEVRGALKHLQTIERWARHSKLAEIMAELQTSGLSGLLACLSPQEQETVSFLYFQLAGNSEVLAKLAEIAADGPLIEGIGQRRDKAGLNAHHIVSPVGGLFLLLPSLLNTPALMRLYGRDEDAWLRYLLFLACSGTDFKESWRDPAVLLAAGLEEAPDLAALPQAQFRGSLDPDEYNLQPEDVAAFNHVLEEPAKSFSPDGIAREELATGAAVLMRSFARTLPALGKSSFEYLWRNVLAGGTRITATAGSILLQLAPRPLHIVLRMAGFHDMSFALPWKPKAEVTIQLDEQ